MCLGGSSVDDAGSEVGAEPYSRADQFARAEERVKPHTDLGQEDRPALFSVDDTHAVLDDGAVFPYAIDRAPQRAAGRHDIFDEQHEIASVQLAFEVVPRAVFLRGLPNNDVRLAAREAHGGGGREGTRLDTRPRHHSYAVFCLEKKKNKADAFAPMLLLSRVSSVP